MNLRSHPYESYRVSNGEWIDQTPSEWEEKRVKDLFKLVTDKAPVDNDQELLSLYASIGVRPRKDLEARGNKASSTDGYWIVKKGDIVVNKLLAWMGSVGLSEYDGVTSPAYDVLRKTSMRVDERYFSYLFRTEIAKQIFKRNSRGIMDMRLRLYFDKLGAITVPVPPFSTQQAIATYIDTKTAQIDRHIELLNEKLKKYSELKQSLIVQTVTRGLDKSVGMKDSGVEWIGKTPTHWNVRRLKEVVDVHMGQSPSSSDYTEEGLGFPFLQGNADFGNYSPTPRVWCSEVKKVCLKNDVLLSVRAPVGAVNVASASYGIGRGLCAIRSKSNYQYWYYFLSSMSSYLNSIATGSTYVAVSIEDVRNSMACVPPAHEQAKITSYLNERTERIDRIVTAINYQLKKLKDLRKALINDVVTGKIKVVGIGNDE
ncbi:restriction endonuclease subunit S [Zwartia sp.]|uniref:restriction endonuclease subunit S n=1 Tax=Zwartia sp. TaxID=2978004 RepID=UPI003BB210B8